MDIKNKASYSIAVILIVVFTLAPLLWCFVISITPDTALLENEFSRGQNYTLTNYINLFTVDSSEQAATINGLTNSLKIASLTVLLGVPLSIISAYGFVRYKFKFKRTMINLMLLTMSIPVLSTIIPLYSIFSRLRILDSVFWTTIILLSAYLPLNTYIAINYLKQLPKELYQAAELDGFKESQIFFRIIIPLSTPIIITNAILLFLMAWKEYMIPSILLSSYNNKPITLIFSEFMGRYTIDYGMIAAVGMLAIIPPIILAIIFRRHLVQGLTSGYSKY